MGQFLDAPSTPRGKFLDEELATTTTATSAPTAPNLAQRISSAVAAPFNKLVLSATQPAVSVSRNLMGESSSQIAKYPTDALERERPGVARSAGEAVVVPQTPTGQLALLGMLLGSPGGIPGQAIGGAIGGDLGQALEGPSSGFPGKGAIEGGLPPLIIGLFGALGGKLYRSTESGARRIAANDAARVGAALDTAAPTLRPGQTAFELQRTAEGQGLSRIGQAKEATVTELEAALSRAPGQTPHFTDAQGQGWVRGASPGQWTKVRARGEIAMPSLGEPSMTIRDANEQLSAIGDMMRGQRPLDPRFKDVNLKEKYREVAQDIERGIDAVIGPNEFASAQANYRAGRGVLKPLQRPGLFEQGNFNIVEFQTWLKNPNNREQLARSLGGELKTGRNLDAYHRVVAAIERGDEAGVTDVISRSEHISPYWTAAALGGGTGLGHMLSGGNTYATAAGALPALYMVARSLFPHLRTKYAGNPNVVGYQNLPPALRDILSVVGQRGLEATLP